MEVQATGCKSSRYFSPVNSDSLMILTAAAELSSIAKNEDALLRHLFQGYQKWIRPVLNSNDTIKVFFGLKISQLVDVVSNPWHYAEKNMHSLNCLRVKVLFCFLPHVCLSVLKITYCERKSAPRS